MHDLIRDWILYFLSFDKPAKLSIHQAHPHLKRPNGLNKLSLVSILNDFEVGKKNSECESQRYCVSSDWK